MLAWEIIDSATVPGTTNTVRLFQRGGEFAIRVDSRELMASGVHGSEDALAELACAYRRSNKAPSLLMGGLGMGYTLAAALKQASADARIVVAELVPAVVSWNRGPLAHLAGNPLADPRVEVFEGDVADAIRHGRQAYDSIMLDVDNGPKALSRSSNDWLCSPRGLSAAHEAIKPGGILAVWSAGPDRSFSSRLSKAGFSVEEKTVRSRGDRGGRKHVIWIATVLC